MYYLSVSPLYYVSARHSQYYNMQKIINVEDGLQQSIKH